MSSRTASLLRQSRRKLRRQGGLLCFARLAAVRESDDAEEEAARRRDRPEVAERVAIATAVVADIDTA